MKSLKRIGLGIVLGLAMGLPGGWFALAELGPQLGFDGSTEMTGVVEARRVEADRVQLMLRAADGESVLATFTERPADVAALARVGDTVVLSLPEPAPIVDEPRIVRVQPEGDERPDPFGGSPPVGEPDDGPEDPEVAAGDEVAATEGTGSTPPVADEDATEPAPPGEEGPGDADPADAA